MSKKNSNINRQAYTEELSQVAEWFENCGIDELTPETVSNIIKAWRPREMYTPRKEFDIVEYLMRGGNENTK